MDGLLTPMNPGLGTVSESGGPSRLEGGGPTFIPSSFPLALPQVGSAHDDLSTDSLPLEPGNAPFPTLLNFKDSPAVASHRMLLWVLKTLPHRWEQSSSQARLQLSKGGIYFLLCLLWALHFAVAAFLLLCICLFFWLCLLNFSGLSHKK